VKKFGGRLKGWLDSFSRFASSWIRGFSPARTSMKFLLSIVTLLLPVTIFVMVPKLRATNTISVTAISDKPMENGFTLREASTSAITGTDGSGGYCAAGSSTDLVNFAPAGGPTNPCSDNPCLNGGTCIPTQLGATCSCTRCWTG
jgi:hypothetical protein